MREIAAAGLRGAGFAAMAAVFYLVALYLIVGEIIFARHDRNKELGQ